MVSILFADIVNFTRISRILSPEELVQLLDEYFGEFDKIVEKWNVEKIKTIGDAYMAVEGVPDKTSEHSLNVIKAAIEMQEYISSNKNKFQDKLGNVPIEMRLGIHTGSVVAGVVGSTKFQFDIWGDAVNVAARIESSGAPGKVNVSVDTYEMLKNEPSLDFESRGSIQIKNRGEIEMFFVEKKLHEPSLN